MVGDWALVTDGVPYAFGAVSSPVFFTEAPEVGTADVAVDDRDVWRGDGVLMGEDFFGGSDVSFELAVSSSSHDGVVALRQRFSQAWRAESVRSRAGAVCELRTHTGRSAFGRPRRIKFADQALEQGVVRGVADFRTVDSLWYGPEVVSEVPFVPAPAGGLVAPLRAPLSTTRASDRSVALTVGGDLPTPVVFEVAGPITNPDVLIGDVRFRFIGLSLAYDEVLTVDARPWVRSITVGGGSAAGRVSPASTRLSRAFVAPGVHAVALRGLSATGMAKLTVRHRPAFTSY